MSYKATADSLPAWFALYPSFSKPVHSDGLDVRFLLPHTVYFYQKDSHAEADEQITRVAYSAEHQESRCTMQKRGRSLARVQNVHAIGGPGSIVSAGSPLIPDATRQLDIDWKGKEVPSDMDLRFEHFSLRHPTALGCRFSDYLANFFANYLAYRGKSGREAKELQTFLQQQFSLLVAG